MTAHLSHPKYRRDIDGLRAIAVLSVVTYHAFPNWMGGGFIGVDVFFVISGFLISTIIFENLDQGTFSFFEFYARRIRRIFPALILVLVACFAFGWFALLADEYKQLGKHIAGGASFISNFVLWNESGYFDNAADTKPLLHLWSLGVEEQFYIAWPLLLWLAYKLGFNLLSLGIAIAVLSFYFNVHLTKTDVVAAFYSPQSRFWELMSGSILAWVTLYKPSFSAMTAGKLDKWLARIFFKDERANDGSTLANTISVFALSLLCYGFWKINKDLGFPGVWASIPVLAAVLIIFAGSSAWVNRTILSNRLVVWFGLISFPLYLWHWPLLSFARIVESGVPDRNIRVAVVVLSVGLAWLTYKLVECPLRLGKHGKAKITLLILLMSIVGYAGLNTYLRNGLSFRFPKVVQELADFRYDYKSAYREGTCFLKPEQTYDDFDGCQVKAKDNKRSILIWGDSHAAHLYPGFKKRYGLDANVYQYTASGCPPILDIDVQGRPNCRAINEFILGNVKKNHVDVIVLSAIWTNYDLSNLEKTISVLRDSGFKNVHLIGPVPQWSDGLPKQLRNYFNKSFPHVIPSRMSAGLNPNFINLDNELSNRMKNIGVHYLSPKDILCDDNGCITKTDDTGGSITAWDCGHLTSTGSELLVSQFPDFW